MWILRDKETPEPKSDINALLGKGAEFTGKLTFEGTVRIDGTFIGEVIAGGTLIVGESALMDGEVNVDSAVIAGTIKGNIHAKNRCELKSTAKVLGDVTARKFAVEEGALINGKCLMESDRPLVEEKIANS